MKKRKLAIIAPYGAEPRLDNYPEFILAQELIKKGWNVRMYTYATHGIPTYNHDLVYKGVPVFRCRERKGISPRLFWTLMGFYPDTILCFHPKSFLNFTAYLVSRVIHARFVVEIVGILHDPCVVNDVDDPIENIKDPIEIITSVRGFMRAIYLKQKGEHWKNYITHMPTANADLIIAINENEQGYIKRVYGKNSKLVYPCVPKKNICNEKKPEARDGHVFPDNFLFFIGQVKLRKGWDTALEAIAILSKQGLKKNLVFVMPKDDIAEPLAYAKQLGIAEQVTFLVAVSNEERNWLYAHCTYVLIPSRYEGFGLPVFEAFLAKKPVCATNIPTFKEFLVDKRNALISGVGNADELAHSIRTLDANQVLRERLIEEGISTASKFSEAQMLKDYIKALELPQ